MWMLSSFPFLFTVCMVFVDVFWFIWWFNCCMSVWGKLMFCAIGCMFVHSFCFLWGVSGSECILATCCLYAAILFSIGWFEEKLIVVFVVVGFRYMSISSYIRISKTNYHRHNNQIFPKPIHGTQIAAYRHHNSRTSNSRLDTEISRRFKLVPLVYLIGKITDRREVKRNCERRNVSFVTWNLSK